MTRIGLLLLCAALAVAAACGDEESTVNDAKPVTTSSGLTYLDQAPGKGDPVKPGQTAVVHYTGWLSDNGNPGQKFDSSRDRGQPFSFRLGAGQVIRGWDEGVAGMRPGGKRRLTIPPDLGYGARGAGNAIPPNASLIFDVELIEIKP